MHINFRKLTLHNFLSFGHSTIEFEDDGFIRVTGINENPDDLAVSNGSGKSSLWEAIIWTLTGDTLRGTKQISNLYGDILLSNSHNHKRHNHLYHLYPLPRYNKYLLSVMSIFALYILKVCC